MVRFGGAPLRAPCVAHRQESRTGAIRPRPSRVGFGHRCRAGCGDHQRAARARAQARWSPCRPPQQKSSHGWESCPLLAGTPRGQVKPCSASAPQCGSSRTASKRRGCERPSGPTQTPKHVAPLPVPPSVESPPWHLLVGQVSNEIRSTPHGRRRSEQHPLARRPITPANPKPIVFFLLVGASRLPVSLGFIG